MSGQCCREIGAMQAGGAIELGREAAMGTARVAGAAILIVAILVASASGARLAPAGAAKVLSASGTATIDGRFAPGEWDGAARVDFAVKEPPGMGGATAPATLSVMNDATNLYLGYQVADAKSVTLGMSMIFDNDGDRVLSEGDETILVYAWQGTLQAYLDEYFSERPPCPAGSRCFGIEDYQTGGTTDGTAAVSRNGSSTYFEVALPLNDGDDTHDFNLGLGDLLAIDPASEFSAFDTSGTGYTGLPSAPIMIVIAPFVPPTITEIAPAHGTADSHVMLAGTHFAGVTAVTFAGGRQAQFELAADSKEIDAIVPHGATAGPVSVTTPGGTAASTKPFTVDLVRPVIGTPTATPARLLAGKPATIRFTVARNDTGARMKGGTVRCDVTIGATAVPHNERFVNGTGTVQLRVPASAKKKTIRIRITATLAGTTTTRTAALRIS